MTVSSLLSNGGKLVALGLLLLTNPVAEVATTHDVRERISLNPGWKFKRFEENPDDISYAKLKAWILPTGNNFIKDSSKRPVRPSAQPPSVSFAEPRFDDKSWESLDLPHDWAVKGPFLTEKYSIIGGGEGRLPIHGVGWYRRTFTATRDDVTSKSVYLDIDGAMSYAMVWLNGNLVGGWPYGYASFRLDLTPYLKAGTNNIAIRVDNAVASSRFYSGAGIYRNVWLTKLSKTHVGQDGTYITSKDVSAKSATLDLVVAVENAASKKSEEVEVVTDVYVRDTETGKLGDKPVASFPRAKVTVKAGEQESVKSSLALPNPRLWGPRPSQEPNLYVAVTRLLSGRKTIDKYETRFGVRTLSYSGDGLRVNGERIYIQGVNQHHDFGSLGSAFNVRAAERQFEMLTDLGVNSVRTSHNPPARELLDMADEMGILMLDEIFDTWAVAKVVNDFNLIFNEWYEADLRSFIRRDRNHPSVVIWSYGNEVVEQRTGTVGYNVSMKLKSILREEDTTRMCTLGANNAGPNDEFTSSMDIIGLNYQGEGRGDVGPLFPDFHKNFPDTMIISTESSSVVSSRGTYLFPVTPGNSANVSAEGFDEDNMHVSAYDLYAVPWGASPDKVFAAQDAYPYVGGEYVWTGWDYLGEPTPFDMARSSYFGFIDLAGFPKDRYYLYQSRWNPTVKMAHILPHWNWADDRVGEVTPVHVFSAADEAELFVNGKSQGIQKKEELTYRFRWDEVVYAPGELHVVTWKAGKPWANATVRTTGDAAALKATTYRERTTIKAGGEDLSFVSIAVVDAKGDTVPLASDKITFSVSGGGEIVSTDNGDPTDMVPFPSHERKAFNGLALVVVRAKSGASGKITVTAKAEGLKAAEVVLTVE
ncbi:glycoside hydrolase superfamily [Apodospora peruviana]|uniref:Glycoside hydrolase superfamily n=1 Tax=Apodospora peruviana TaxID=516989 RepID=A0AAE0M1S1_9PEZI|nr:glycoside hydrolase superfamily [Apodospora peruviana]